MVLRNRNVLFLVGVAVVTVVIGCGVLNGPAPEPRGKVLKTYPVLDGSILSAAWLSPHQMAFLVLAVDSSPSGSRKYLTFLDTDDSIYREVAISKIERCTGGEIPVELSSLPDGRLGYLTYCVVRFTEVSDQVAHSHIQAIDTTSFAREMLVHVGPPFRVTQYAFAPDMQSALLGELINGIHSQINVWRKGEGLQGAPFITEIVTRGPDWSADGKWITYRSGPGKLDSAISGIAA